MKQLLPMIVRDPVEYLRVFLNERGQATLGPHEVVYILKTVAREILPAAGLRGRCAQLDLFTDWTVHGEIDRSPCGQAAIAKIAEAIPLHGQDGHDNKWFEEQVNDAVSFGALRLDLLAVCQRFELAPGFFTTPDAWHRFALPLSFEISGRPVRLGRKEARRRVDNTPLHADDRPNSITLWIEQKDGKRWWRVGTDGDKGVLSQVLFGSFRAEDFPTPAGWVSPLAQPGTP